jgi:hypothetical protein
MCVRRMAARQLHRSRSIVFLCFVCRTAAATSSISAATARAARTGAPGGQIRKKDDVNITFVTWNLAQCSPSKADCAFLSSAAADSAVVAIGLQEVEMLKPRRQEGRRSRLIRRIFLSTLGKDFVPVSTTRLGSIQMFVFIRKSLKGLIDRRSLRTWEVSCGVGNVLQNKGALGLAMNIGGHRLALIAAHLAAHQSKVGARNADFWRIMRESEKALTVDGGTDEDDGSDGSDPDDYGSNDSIGALPWLDSLDCIVFGGDLNYRLELSREEVQLSLEDFVETDGIASLLDHDQLTHARASEAAFGGFSEGPIAFPPTFKFDKTSDTYDTSKKRRVPAWTDRVLYKAASGVATLNSYRQIPDSRHSDHRAVLAQILLTGGPSPSSPSTSTSDQ